MVITMNDNMTTAYDVIIIGGGAAGLSGALTLARSRRSVLVIDAGEPRNAPAAGVHGFLTRNGMNPQALFYQLGNKPGWTQPGDFREVPAAAKKWLKENAGTYRIERFVTEDSDKK